MAKGTPTQYPGIYKLPTGQYFVRRQVKDEATGKYRDSSRTLPEGKTIAEALQAQIDLGTELNRTDPASPDSPKPRFKDFAPTVNESRSDRGLISSPQTKDKNKQVLEGHLVKRWGDHFIDKITPDEVEDWNRELGRRVQAKEYTPHTVNTWWREFKKYMAAASAKFRLHNPTAGLHSIPLSLHRTYTAEEPNALEAAELPDFFAACWEVEREHFAFFALGIMTGRRPCELRPLRHEGRPRDLDWDKRTLQIRRSQTRGAPTEMTKTKKDVVIYLRDSALYGVLQSHVGSLTGARKGSPLLFPPLRAYSEEASGYMSRSALDKPLDEICKKAKIKRNLTPRFMRRTYQDLCRVSGVSTTVQKAMSGHATDAMIELYSSVAETEGSAALRRMSDVAGLKEAARL